MTTTLTKSYTDCVRYFFVKWYIYLRYKLMRLAVSKWEVRRLKKTTLMCRRKCEIPAARATLSVCVWIFFDASRSNVLLLTYARMLYFSWNESRIVSVRDSRREWKLAKSSSFPNSFNFTVSKFLTCLFVIVMKPVPVKKEWFIDVYSCWRPLVRLIRSRWLWIYV